MAHSDFMEERQRPDMGRGAGTDILLTDSCRHQDIFEGGALFKQVIRLEYKSNVAVS